MSSIPHLAPRLGRAPETSRSGPHSQLTQTASPCLWWQLVARAFSLEHVTQGRSRVSMATSLAGLLLELPQQHGPWSLATDGPIEVFHKHAVTDTSLHAVLPDELARQVIARGWGERHTFADYDTQLMLYAPRTESELETVISLLEQSIRFAQSSVRPE